MDIQCIVQASGERISVPMSDLKRRRDVEPVVCWAHKRFVEQRDGAWICPACGKLPTASPEEDGVSAPALRHLRLNLACGSDYREGWVNLDVVAWPGYREPDAYWDARKGPIPCPSDAATEIYMGYTLMHVAPCYHEPLLKEVRRVLSPEGVLAVGEVDMGLVMPKWLEDPANPALCDSIWGEQGNVHGSEMAQWDKHCHGFTEGSLRALLETNGFGDIRRIQIHAPEVWYELTLACRKVG